MKSKIISKRRLEVSVVCALIFSILLSVSHFEAVCDDMRGNVLRLHIIANSDSAEDQALKIKVRDRILEDCSYVFDENTDLSSAITCVQKNLSSFEESANAVIKENGFEYEAQANIGMSYFETREYESFTLPAGEYKSLIIILGEGKGKNWWCVVFPTVCIPSAAGELTDSVCEKSGSVAQQPKRYIMRFKIVEIYEDLKNFLKK